MIGPNEISIYHPRGIELLDGPKSATTKDAFYDILRPDSSAIFTRDETEHTDRRKTWTHALSQRSMDTLRPRIANVALNLRGAVDEFVSEGKPVNINDLMAWFSFDVMGELVFSQDFGSIKNRSTHPAFTIQEHALGLLGPILDTQWIAQMGFAFFPFLGNVKRWLEMVAFCKEQMADRFKRHEEAQTSDMAGYFINEFRELNAIGDEKYPSKHFDGTTISVVVAR
jgi:cytochrome P450